MDVGNLISGSSAFSKSSLSIWKFPGHILLKPGLDSFENYFANVWDKCNCAVLWAFFGIAFLWDWNESRPFPVLWLAYWAYSPLTASSFRIWNSSTPLALFLVMLPKSHLTSHSRISGSRWVITPLWLSGSWRSFLYSSSVYSCHLFLTSASVRSTQFLSLIVPIIAMKYSFSISNFLEEISSLSHSIIFYSISHSIVFLYFFALILKTK